MDLHRVWDGVITSSQNLTRLRNEAKAHETARSFSGVSSPNLRPLALSREQKKATRLQRRLLTVTADQSGFRRVVLWTARDGRSGSSAACGICDEREPDC